MNFIVNLVNYAENYLQYLNECFPNWGNIDNFNWAIDREFAGQKPDFFVITSNDNIVLAGSAISYRKLKFPDNSFLEIGIMTGSWTLAASRGLGCFTAAINKSCELVAIKNKPFLTAFVTESNASSRRLIGAGSHLVKTNYIISEHLLLANKHRICNVEVLEKSHVNIQLLFEKRKVLLQNKIHFDYDFADFEKQFIKRLNPVFIIKIDNEFAIIEETNSIFQLHFCTNYELNIITKIITWANKKSKEIIFFSTNSNHQFSRENNFKVIDGFFTVLKSEKTSTIDCNMNFNDIFVIEFGDKM